MSNTRFRRSDLPLAFTMIDTAKRIKPRRDGRHPYDKFFLFWIAFNAIYTSIARQKGDHTELIENADGTIATHPNGNVNIPVVKNVSELAQIQMALDELESEIEFQLLNHPSTKFFLDRVPFWNGKPIKEDAMAQRINGVIHVNDTSRPDYPVWSPLDVEIYARYTAKPDVEQERKFLVQQVAGILLTVRENLLSFSKNFDDSNDIAVIEHALPLIERIVSAFLR